MTLSEFYDRVLMVDGSLSEGELRLLLQGALDHISESARVPMLHVEIPVNPVAGEFQSVDAGQALRQFLTVPAAAQRANPSLSVTLDPGASVLTVSGCEEPFVLVCEGMAPVVPTDASVPGVTGGGWPVPWGECALSYVKNGLLASVNQEASRVEYARFRDKLVLVKQVARRPNDARTIQPQPDPSIYNGS